MDPAQTAHTGAVRSGSALFIYGATKNIQFVIMRFKG